MKFLLDTHLLLWAAGAPERLSAAARAVLLENSNSLFFSVASLWEIVIKHALGCDDFQVDVRLLRRGLLDNGYTELPIYSAHIMTLSTLPLLHKDPFDRLLVAQAHAEGITLLTHDACVAQYPGPVQRV